MRGGAIPLPLHPQRQFDHLLVVRYLGQPCKVQSLCKRDPYRIICGARGVAARTVGLLRCGAVGVNRVSLTMSVSLPLYLPRRRTSRHFAFVPHNRKS